MARSETFHGYGPEQGYDFLRSVIAEKDFHARGVDIADDEIFISDGAKSDCGNIGDILDVDNVIAVCDPVYPVYVDSNAMAGRAGDYDAEAERWTNITYMPTTAENGFCPALPEGRADVIYLCSPNNPTGQRASTAFIEELLDATDALVLVDEAYFEFSRATVRPLLATHENLAILRTFSKAFSLAGARLGYVLANTPVIEELCKVRQPYSVDAVSQAIGEVVFENRARFEPGIREIIEERGRVMEALRTLPGVTAYPSDSNWILFSMEDAGAAWQYLYDRGVLVRDFSSAPMLEGCLRATIGTPEQNDAFIRGLRDFLAESRAQRARAMQ